MYNYGSVYDSKIGSMRAMAQPQPMPSYPMLDQQARQSERRVEAPSIEAQQLEQMSEVKAASQISAADAEAKQIKEALKAMTGIESLTDEQWNTMVE